MELKKKLNDFYTCLKACDTPTETVRCFGDMYRYMFSTECKQNKHFSELWLIIVEMVLYRFKIRKWSYKSCEDWNKEQVRDISQLWENIKEKRFNKNITEEQYNILLGNYLNYVYTHNLSDSVMLWAFSQPLYGDAAKVTEYEKNLYKKCMSEDMDTDTNIDGQEENETSVTDIQCDGYLPIKIMDVLDERIVELIGTVPYVIKDSNSNEMVDEKWTEVPI